MAAVRHGLSTRTRKGVETAATALSAALARVDPIDAQPVLAVLVERLHNAAAWAALMMPASTELGRVLLPVLESGALLAHSQTRPAAARLVAELSEHEPGLAARLEAAVLQAHALIDANGGPQWTKDTLIGCLRAEAITSTALTDRLAELGPDGPPDIPQKHTTAGVMPWSPVDELIKQQEPPVAAAAAALSDELKLITSGTDDRPESERRLHELFTDADAAFAPSASLPQGLQRLLVDAAAVLARDPRVLPDTPLGTRILALLTAAATSTDEGKFHE